MLETLNISLGGLRRIESPAGCEVIVNCLYHSRRLPVFGRLRDGGGIIEGCDGCSVPQDVIAPLPFYCGLVPRTSGPDVQQYVSCKSTMLGKGSTRRSSRRNSQLQAREKEVNIRLLDWHAHDRVSPGLHKIAWCRATRTRKVPWPSVGVWRGTYSLNECWNRRYAEKVHDCNGHVICKKSSCLCKTICIGYVV
jgi:hypothetical protein